MQKISDIDTSKEAKRIFNGHFKDSNRTIFLNGKWGSGKTTFLKEVFKNKEKRLRVVHIDLWRRANDSEVVQTFYRKIYPFSFYSIKGIVILFSLVALIAAFLIGSIQSPETITLSLLFLGFIISLNTYVLKIDWESFFFTTLKYRIKCQILNKIVVIDDFDRISEDTQEVLYKIFNSINSKKIQLVFVGHYINLTKSETSYLQKIIDHRIELPFDIQPTNIWKKYDSLVIEEMSEKRQLELTDNEKEGLDSLISLAIKENRVIRELNQFSDIVSTVIMDNEKYDKVNLDQQLIIIYLYEFHYDLYEILISKIEHLLKERNRIIWEYSSNTQKKEQSKTEQLRKMVNKTFDSSNGELKNIIFQLFPEKSYPFATFAENFPNYLINYQPNNLGSNKFMSLLREEKFEEIIKMASEDLEDFHYFITKNQNSNKEEFEENLFPLALYVLQSNMGIDYFFYENNNEARLLDRVASIGLFTKYSKHLADDTIAEIYLDPADAFKTLDLSQRIRICNRYYGMEFKEINDRCKGLILNAIKNLGENYGHPSILLTAITSLKEDQIGIDIKSFENFINNLSEKEFLYYLFYNSISTETKFKVNIKKKEVYRILDKRLKKIDESYLSYEFELVEYEDTSENEFDIHKDIYPI